MNPSPSSSTGAIPLISVCKNSTNPHHAASTSVTAVGWTPWFRTICSNVSAAALQAIGMTNGINGSSDKTLTTYAANRDITLRLNTRSAACADARDPY
jgi:hypothetical protein